MRDEPLVYSTTPSSKAGVSIMKLTGPLTLANMFTFQNDLKASEAAVLILDLSEVPYMDSAGMGVILNYHVSSSRKNQKMIIASTNARVQALFELTRVDKILTMTPTVEAAEALA